MDDPWFIYEKGRARHRIVPRNAKGYVSFFLFMAFVLLPIFPVVMPHLSPWWATVCVIWFVLLLWPFFRFAASRSEIRRRD